MALFDQRVVREWLGTATSLVPTQFSAGSSPRRLGIGFRDAEGYSFTALPSATLVTHTMTALFLRTNSHRPPLVLANMDRVFAAAKRHFKPQIHKTFHTKQNRLQGGEYVPTPIVA
jgi:hypothetical protein